MRPEVEQLIRIGPLPASSSDIATIKQWQRAVEKITPPLSDEEATALAGLFPPIEDECYGLAWTLVHLVESAPHWPLKECLQDGANPWIVGFRQRAHLD
jgi:hypothetical protein